MLEVEVKYAVADFAAAGGDAGALGGRRRRRGATPTTTSTPPTATSPATDEAFRLRRIGDNNFVTYKGPKLRRPDQDARLEIEVPLADGDRVGRRLRRAC